MKALRASRFSAWDLVSSESDESDESSSSASFGAVEMVRSFNVVVSSKLGGSPGVACSAEVADSAIVVVVVVDGRVFILVP